MSQFFIHANEHENFMQVEGHKRWWPRVMNKVKDFHPEHNPAFDVSLETLWSQGDIDETAIRGVLAARACTIDNFQEFMRTSPEDRIWLIGLVLDGLQALPKSNESYVARTRGELEQLVRFFRKLHRNELKFDNRSMKGIVINDDDIAMRISKFLSEPHSALSTAVLVFGKGSGAAKGNDLWEPLANAE
jgi:hypothetical protein